jgi:AcrR family transcriptional regulator
VLFVSPRRYEMRARAESASATRARIVRATLDLAEHAQSLDFTLDQVAQCAGTSVQTILRHFGTRDGLVTAAIAQASAEVAGERRAPGAGVDADITALVDHYERRGPFVLRLLAQDDDASRAVTEPGKQLHRQWVAEVFADALPAAGPRRDALVDMLVVVTDVYAWKLLRLDRGLDRDTVEARIRNMTRSILAGSP